MHIAAFESALNQQGEVAVFIQAGPGEMPRTFAFVGPRIILTGPDRRLEGHIAPAVAAAAKKTRRILVVEYSGGDVTREETALAGG